MPVVESDQVRGFRALMKRREAEPCTVAERVLGASFWSKQREGYALCWQHDRVWLKGGHSTGKTHLVSRWVPDFVATTPSAKVLIIGPKFDQARINLWGLVQRAYSEAKIPLGGRMGADSWQLGPEWWARVAGADKPESLHGTHGVAVTVIVDEASGIEPWAWAAIDSLMASSGSRLIVMFNPIRPDGMTRSMVDDPRFRGVTFSCLDHPNVTSGEDVYPGAVTKKWVEDVAEKLRRGVVDDDYWRSRVLGEFASGDANAVTTRADLTDAWEHPSEVTDQPRIGLDVARFGGDQCVMTVLDAKRSVVDVQSWMKADLMETTGRLVAAIRQHKVAPPFACVDVCGIGAGVVDRCREQGIRVTPVDFGEGAKGDWRRVLGREASFTNRRAELHWLTRALLKSRQLRVDPRWVATWADLTLPRYAYDSSGSIKIESKDEIRKRVGRSPDFGDSLIIALGKSPFTGGGFEML